MYATKKILLPEIRRLGMECEDCADDGWAVVEISGDDETVVDWFADHHVAIAEAERLNGEDGGGELGLRRTAESLGL